MSKRVWLTLTGALIVVGALGAVKTLQVQAAIAQSSSFQPPPEAVTTIEAKRETWPATFATFGTVEAVRGVTVAADLPGVVEWIGFESGRPVREGEVLVRLDARQERAQLAAAEAQHELAHANLDRVQGLFGQGILAQAELDRVVAEARQSEARVGEIRATIERKQIRAPFAGVLGIRKAHLGQYMNAGDPIVPLQALDPVHVTFAVPQQKGALIQIGGTVQVNAEGRGGEAASGRITAIDSVVDPATRNLQVQATLGNEALRLRPGMFVNVMVDAGQGIEALSLPASSISYAPYGDSVFVVAEIEGPNGSRYTGVRQQFVRVGGARGDQVAVVSGLEPGALVVTSGVFKLRGGAAVKVDNAVRPSNDAAPRPEDN